MSQQFQELKAYVLDIRDHDEDPDANDPSRCRLWDGAVDKEGRGQVRFLRRKWNLPRLVLGLMRKRWLTEEEVVLHLCNNPKYYRPSHLAIGTQQQNMEQMVRGGRARNQHSTKGLLEGLEKTIEPVGLKPTTDNHNTEAVQHEPAA